MKGRIRRGDTVTIQAPALRAGCTAVVTGSTEAFGPRLVEVKITGERGAYLIPEPCCVAVTENGGAEPR